MGIIRIGQSGRKKYDSDTLKVKKEYPVKEVIMQAKEEVVREKKKTETAEIGGAVNDAPEAPAETTEITGDAMPAAEETAAPEAPASETEKKTSKGRKK